MLACNNSLPRQYMIQGKRYDMYRDTLLPYKKQDIVLFPTSQVNDKSTIIAVVFKFFIVIVVCLNSAQSTTGRLYNLSFALL